jgi:hypothetical protein
VLGLVLWKVSLNFVTIFKEKGEGASLPAEEQVERIRKELNFAEFN